MRVEGIIDNSRRLFAPAARVPTGGSSFRVTEPFCSEAASSRLKCASESNAFAGGVSPFHRERRSAFQGGPGRLADHSYSVRARNHAHTANRERLCLLRTLRFRAGPRCSLDRGVEHLRNFCVDAVARRACHDIASIDAPGRLSDQVKIARLFQRRVGRNRKLRRIGHQLSILETAFARGVNNFALGRRTGRRDPPSTARRPL